MRLTLTPELAIIFLVLSAFSLSFAVYFSFQVYSALSPRLKARSLNALGSVLLVLVLAYAVYYISDLNETCLACHAVNNLSKQHQKLRCISCHKDPGLSGAMVFKLKQARMFSRLRSYELGMSLNCSPNEKCISCHKTVLKTLNGKSVRVRHVDFLNQTKCIWCHEKEVHAVFEPESSVMSRCLYCHSPLNEEKKCQFCHLRQRSVLKYSENLNLQHTSSFFSIHGFRSIKTCEACHEKDFCNRCHPSYPHDKGFNAQHGKAAIENVQECRKCHLIIKCNDCHGIEMPHIQEWKKVHGKKAVNDWKRICSRCHTFGSCRSCHSLRFINDFKERTHNK